SDAPYTWMWTDDNKRYLAHRPAADKSTVPPIFCCTPATRFRAFGRKTAPAPPTARLYIRRASANPQFPFAGRPPMQRNETPIRAPAHTQWDAPFAPGPAG